MAHAFKTAAHETLTGTRTLTLAEVRTTAIWAFDPGGAGRDVVLPNASTAVGQFLVIANLADAAEVLTIKADSATVCTPTQAETAVLFCTGTTWVGIAGANS